MTMNKAPIYKRDSRDKRRIIQDGNFAKGMYYTSNLVDSATSRLLMNYSIRDRGRYITPRLGLRIDKTHLMKEKDIPYHEKDKVPGVHAGFFGMYTGPDGLDDFGDIVLSFGVPSSYEYNYYDTDKDLIDDSFRNQVFTNIDGDSFGLLKDSDKEEHIIDMSAVKQTRLRYYDETVKPLYTVHNNKLYTIDGASGNVIDNEDYESSGEIVREMRFPYDGSFTSFEVRPRGVDYLPFTISSLNSDGSSVEEVFVSIPLLYLESNGVYNYYDGVANNVHENIKTESLSELAFIVEEKTNTSFLKIPKPEGSFVKGSVSADNFKTTEIPGSTELNMSDSAVLDNTNNIGKYSSMVDEDYIIFVMHPGSTVSDAEYDMLDKIIKYELVSPIIHPMGQTNPFTPTSGGRISFNVPGGAFRLSASYTILYNRPIYDYSGGIQEYSFVWGTDTYEAIPKSIEAKQPKISEATSVGFNMLHTNPYSFSNTEGIVIQPLGIMPYKPGSSQEILISANLGEEIEFELFYEYAKNEKYYVKWEYLPLTTGPLREPVVVSESTTSVTGGTSFRQIIKANDEKFTLRATIFPEHNGTKDEARGKVVLYPSYETGNSYLKDISTHEYDLHNASGIGNYKTMLTLWGVPGAETTLFFSDIDDVSYFPFPNNIVSFTHKVLGTHSYMGGLLVITTNSIYAIEGNSPHDFEVTEIYQGLTFSEEDVESLKVIKNIIFIRSRNNYYTITPNIYTGDITDVRMTTVSAPIKELVSDWEDFLQFITTSVYDIPLEWTRRTEVKQYDFFNYLSGDDQVKNVYRFVIKEDQVGGDKKVRYQIDVVLVFHVNQQIWTLETINLPYNEAIAFKDKIYSSYASKHGDNTRHHMQILEYKSWNREDLYNTSSFGYYDNDINVSRIEEDLQNLPERVTDTVVRVIDGDTIETANFGSVRFHYVDAPEDTTKSDEFGPEATQIMKNFLPVGSEVTLEFEGDRSDRYGRVLAWVFNDEGVLAQLHLSELGGVKSVYDFGVDRYTSDIDYAIEQSIKNKVGLWETYEGELETIQTPETLEVLSNYQVMDTGNKNHDPYLTKRYREFQFQITNRSTDSLEWFNRFYIDAKAMQDFRDYELHHVTDPKHPDYGTISVIPKDTSNTDTDAVTFLNSWELGKNAFPELDLIRIRFKLSGKGAYPRLLMISKNEANYDFLGYSWILRQMNYR